VASKEVLDYDYVIVSESFVDSTCLIMAGSRHGSIWSVNHYMIVRTLYCLEDKARGSLCQSTPSIASPLWNAQAVIVLARRRR
jgi:hypothetical protein